MLSLSYIRGIIVKKIAIWVSICCSTISISGHANAQLTNDVVRARMQQGGFMLEKGTTLLPAEKIMAPNSLKSLWVVTPNLQNANKPESNYRERIEELLQLGHVVQAMYNANANNHDRNSAVLRKNMSDIHMAYSFTPVPDADVTKSYGFAACGTFNDGWTGVTEFFQKQDVGNCAYTENNFTLAHATANVNEAIVRYDVSNKATTVIVEGHKDSGYLYTVAWMDTNYFRTLECAVKRDVDNMTAEVVSLAQRIDNQ